MSLPSVPPGFQYTTLTLPGGGWNSQSIPYGQSPAIVTGDTLMTPLLTQDGFSVVAGADGIVSVGTGGSDARQLLIGVDIFDVSADAFVGAATFAINNQSPNAELIDTVVLRHNQVMTALDLAADFSDVESDALTFAETAGSAPTGTSVNGSGQWTGTPSAESTGSFTLTGTDPYGASDTLVVSWAVIDQVSVPDVDDPGTSEGAALALLAAAFLVGTVSSRVSSALVPQGEVISQSPLPDALVDPGSTVTLVISRGNQIVNLGGGFDFGFGFGFFGASGPIISQLSTEGGNQFVTEAADALVTEGS